MSLFRLDSSITPQSSVSRRVADSLEQAWTAANGGAVVRRDLGASPIPAETWQLAVTAGFAPEDQRTPQQRAAVALAAAIGDELLAADAVVIASPLYNFSVPAQIKAWIDLLITDPRFGPGNTPLAGKPVSVVIARGGGYGPGTPRAGWDHATPWLEQIFRDVWGGDLTVVAAELTLAQSVPAMAELKPLADQSLEAAHKLATETGAAHASRLAVAS